MAVTVNSIITNFNSYIGDTSTDRITAAERLQYITEGVVWLQEELHNDTQTATYSIAYYDTVHYYKVTASIADLLEGADLRRGEDDQTYAFSHKSSRELAEDIGTGLEESAWSIERRDGNTYLVINHASKYDSQLISALDSLTDGGGTWAADTTTSDATNLTVDSIEYKQGSGSLNFDVTVAQSGNNRATISNSTMTSLDLTSYNNLSSFLIWVYIPEVTNFSSVTLYWGSSTSNYFSATVTTDIEGHAFVDGWNRLKFDWTPTTTTTGTPVVTAMTYMRIDMNYTGSYTNITDFRIDDILLSRPENLTFYYLSWNVGTSAAGADITAFTATTDIPFFSGQYDQYKYAVAHKAAALCFQNLRLSDEAQFETREAERILARAATLIPSTKTPETKNFKVRGINLTRRNRRRR